MKRQRSEMSQYVKVRGVTKHFYYVYRENSHL